MKHGDGAWYADEGTFVQLAARGQIVLRYAEDVNGSLGNVAGVVNEAGNVMGLMPHPEHAVDPLLGSADGGLLLAALVDAAAGPSRSQPRKRRRRRHAHRLRPSSPRPAHPSSAERRTENGRARERRPQPLDVARPHRDGTPSRGSPVVYANRTRRSPLRVSRSCTTTANRRSPALCGTETSSRIEAGPHGVAALAARSRATVLMHRA